MRRILVATVLIFGASVLLAQNPTDSSSVVPCAGSATIGQVATAVSSGINPGCSWQSTGSATVTESAISNSEFVSVSGTNTLSGSTATTYASLSTGFTVRALIANTNTGAVTFALNGISGTPAVSKSVNGTITALSGGELNAHQIYLFMWDGTEWQIIATYTNGTNGQGLTSNGTGGFGTPVTFATSATTDATNASNITSGTLAAARVATLNQNTSGTAANLSGTPALPNGTTATTQSQADDSTKIATTAYVDTGLSGKASSSAATTVNSQTCTLGSTCTIPLSAVNPETATYQVLASDFSNYKTITVASGTFTITLVASGSQPANGQYVDIINYGTGVVTVARSGQNVNGGTTSLTIAAGSATAPTGLRVISDGTNYFAVLLGGGTGGGAVSSVNSLTGAVSILTALADGAQTLACDGSTDDTTAANALINGAGSAGYRVVWKKNCTSIIGNLSVGANANNVTLDLNGSTLRFKSGSTGRMFFAQFTFGLTIENGALDCNNVTGVTNCVELDNDAAIKLSHVQILNVGTPGVGNFQHGLVIYANTGRITIEDSNFSNISGYAIQTNGATDVVLHGNTMSVSYKGGEYISSSTNVTSAHNFISHVTDYGGSSAGAAGNGIDVNSGSTGFSSVGDNISYTEYSSVRFAGSSGNSVTGLISNYAGDWPIYCADFASSRNNCSNNEIPTSMGGCIYAANAGDNMAFYNTVNNNNCGWTFGSGTNGVTGGGQFASGILLDGFVNAVGNTVSGSLYGIGCNNQETGVFSEVGCDASNNQISEGRPVTVTLTGTSGSVAGSQNGVQTDKIYLTSGSSLAAASFSANVLSCYPISSGVTCTSPTSLTVIPINGYPTAAGITDNGPTGNLTATVSTIVGPANYNLTIGSISGGAFSLFDLVTTGTGATQAAGMVTCSTSIQTSNNCATNHYVISGILNSTGLMVAFPSSGTITDSTSGATATISANTAYPQNMQYGMLANNADTGVGSIKFLNNDIRGAQQALYGGINGSTISGTIGAGTIITGPTAPNCASAATPAACGSAANGAVAIPTGVSTVTLIVNTTTVTGNSRISLQTDDSLTIPATTCNSTLATLVGGMAVTARTPGTSFTITYNGTIATNPLCVSYQIEN